MMPMEQYLLKEAQEHLQKLIDDAQDGKTVLILDEQNRVVKLVPMTTLAKPRKAGSARGQIKMAEDSDAPLSDFDEYIE